MKIVIEAHIFSSSTGRYVRELLTHLQQVDTTNNYVVILDEKDFDAWNPTSANFQKVSFRYKKLSLLSQFYLLRFIKSHKPELVHFTFQPDVFTPLIGSLYRGRKVMTIHDLTQIRIKNRKRSRGVFEILHIGFKYLLRINARSMTHIITPTEFVKHDVADYLRFPQKDIFVTLEAADLSHNNPLPSQPLQNLQNIKFILYVGTAHAHKNLPTLVDAFAILQQTHPDLHLVIAGKHSVFHESLKAYIDQQKIQNVVLTGFIEDAKLAWLYSHCSAYVFPSLSEGFGLPGLEAMSYGAPVISSSATCLPEVYGDAAHYFNPYSPTDMANKINSVLTDNRFRQQLIANGKKQLKKYSWKKMANQTLQIYLTTTKK